MFAKVKNALKYDIENTDNMLLILKPSERIVFCSKLTINWKKRTSITSFNKYLSCTKKLLRGLLASLSCGYRFLKCWPCVFILEPKAYHIKQTKYIVMPSQFKNKCWDQNLVFLPYSMFIPIMCPGRTGQNGNNATIPHFAPCFVTAILPVLLSGTLILVIIMNFWGEQPSSRIHIQNRICR